ncbi:amidase [Elioraea rosea]|uniref:amidase n=1 Tax=Elioraea rosea TaxID=2492390 RepID=UPI001950DF43|nr:amidase family protein [Elioraea rosea]
MPHDASLATLSARAMRDLVASRQVSPVEIAEAVLRRVDALEPSLNAFVVRDGERAMDAAREAERAVTAGKPLGPLHGVPVTIKDIQAAAGLPTRRGSRLSDATPTAEDAPSVARLRAAGAIIIGKTTMPEAGWIAASDSPLTGATHNPWKHGMTAGGSSSGAAALAAAGCAPLHLGTDGAGSVRLPAHFCGVVGFKPTYGSVPYVPVPNNFAVSHIGPITRDVEDAALMLAVMSGAHPLDLTTLPSPFPATLGSRPLAGLRIAYSPDLGHARVDADVAAAVADAAKTFERLGATVEQVTPPWGTQGGELCRALWGPPLLPLIPAEESRRGEMDPGLRALLAEATKQNVTEILAAQTRRLAYAGAVNTWFASGWDLLLTPSASVAAFPVGRVRPEHWPEHGWDWIVWAEFSYPFNLSHGPAISVPCGLAGNGMPIGLQLGGPRLADRLVMQAAAAFLEAQPFAIVPARA